MADTKPQQRKKEESAKLRGEGDQIKFIREGDQIKFINTVNDEEVVSGTCRKDSVTLRSSSLQVPQGFV